MDIYPQHTNIAQGKGNDFIANVMCRASFRGEATKEQLYIILEYIDDMKQRGYVFEKHERTELDNGNVKFDYVLALHGT